jgi:4-amino-4-deoxy-L-arabinose transferase-like glycosyltransferase
MEYYSAKGVLIKQYLNIFTPFYSSKLVRTMWNNYLKYLKYILVISLLYMPVFGHLDSMPIRLWDESRLAINAYEMHKHGNYIVTHFDREPDMWNSKPPLMIWFQVFFMKILGVNELAVRLPSAIATLLTCLGILFFFVRYFKDFWLGFASVMVLITTYGYVAMHVTRSGDYDALLVFNTTLSGLAFFAYTEHNKNKYLYLFYVFLALAVLTKGIAGLLFLPAFLIYILIRRQFTQLLKNRHLYIGAGIFLFFTLGYYLLREMYNPGFMAEVWENELGGRYLKTIAHHKHSFWFYFSNLAKFNMTAWYLLIPCGIAVGFLSNDRKIKNLTIFSFLTTLVFLIVISISKTKLQWYDAPAYPFIAIIVGVFINFVFNYLKSVEFFKLTLKHNIIPYIFLFLIFFAPYKIIFNKTYKPKEYPWDVDSYSTSYFLKDAVKGKHDLDGFNILYDGVMNTHLLFYVNVLNDQGKDIDFKDWNELESGDRVITHQDHIKDFIKQNFTYTVIKDVKQVSVFEIH